MRATGFLKIIVMCIVMTFVCRSAHAEDNLRIRGYIKPLMIITDNSSLDLTFTGSGERPDEQELSLSTNLRLSAFSRISRGISVEVAYEMTPVLRNPDTEAMTISLQGPDPLSYRAADAGRTAVSRDGSDLVVYQNIDRLFVTFTTGRADIHLGRQPVAFGSARAVNPTDIFTAFRFSEINTEDRTGIDALRIRMPLGDLSELDAGIIAGDGFRPKKSAAFIRGRFIAFGADISPMVAIFGENLMLGLDIASSAGDAGLWIEAAAVLADATGGRSPEDDYFRLSTGIDYNFSGNFYTFIEYHFNGAGEHDPGNHRKIIAGLINQTAYRDGAVYLLGRHYLAPGFRYELTPLITASGRALFNMDDGSLLVYPSISYSLSDDAVLDAGAFISFGKKSGITAAQNGSLFITETSSEFGLYADIYFISARYYF
jgi:hypothetical protein